LHPILDSQGHYKGQATYAYERDRPLWITAPDKGLLNKNPDRCVDQWSHCEELPPYVDYGEGEGYSKTSIIIPLRYGQKVFGFLNLEFPEYYEFCRNARDELLSLTESLGRIISLHETSIERSMGTQEAFSTLETELSTPFSPLQKPTVFLATSSKADEAVVGIIRKVLGEYHIHFNVSYWKTISTSGNINFQILEAIASSRYGVCYLSEQIPREGNNARFRDNANVLFEAGMLHALTNDPQGKPDAWIPIREAATVTGAVPFDFASERIVEVPRDSNGTLIEEAFVTNLRKQIDLLVPPRY
jgi:hypothetical protein